jgi:hypothetical protein
MGMPHLCIHSVPTDHHASYEDEMAILWIGQLVDENMVLLASNFRAKDVDYV